MADDDSMPHRVPWIDEIRRTKQLKLFTGDSVGRYGWTKAFKEGIAQFNMLARNLNLGVSYVAEPSRSLANVIAEASVGDYTIDSPDFAGQTFSFDGTAIHGESRGAVNEVTDHQGTHYQVKQFFIYVPATPTPQGASRSVGDPVKLVIAVHEMIHACGLVAKKIHTTDDVFAWPSIHAGNTPDQDTVVVPHGTQTLVVKGRPPRQVTSMLDMPPLVIGNKTAGWIREVWG